MKKQQDRVDCPDSTRKGGVADEDKKGDKEGGGYL